MGLWKTRFFRETETVLAVGNGVDIPGKNTPVFHSLPTANSFHKLSLWIPQAGVDGLPANEAGA